jgi:hypothetical protein
MDKGEIILYRPQDKNIAIDVLVENETVWLTQIQMTELFETSRQNVSLHINNIINEGELQTDSTIKESLIVRKEGNREVRRKVPYYNLDMIISVGYRVKSQRGIDFRIWATKILKDYIMRGYAVSQRFERLESRVAETEKSIDFFVKSSLPPKEGIFYDGQIFDAYIFASDLIKTAKKRIVLLDNYINEMVLLLLSKRNAKVSAEIYTRKISKQLRLDLTQHNAQYDPITIRTSSAFHDRFLIVDGTVYHIGASLKDLGKKLFAFSKMDMKPTELLKNV